MSTLEKRTLRDGDRWLIRWREGGRSRARTFREEVDALRWQAVLDATSPTVALRMLDDAASGEAAAAEMTVEAWVRRHIDSLSGVTAGTRIDYHSYLRRHIAPLIGFLPLPALDRETVGKWVNDLAGEGLSGKTIRNRHGLLSASLTAAVRAGLIPTNHAKGVRIPDTGHESVEMVLLTTAERSALVAAMDERYRPLVLLLLLTGLRWGEVSALTVRHLDLDNAALRVRQSWKHTAGGKPELGPPKTPRARRAISLDPATVSLLRTVIKGKGADDFLFTAPRGAPLQHSHFYDQFWAPAVARFAGDERTAGKSDRRKGGARGPGKRPRIHDLRHNHAAVLIWQGVPLTYIQRRLGHESIQTTSDLYATLLPDAHAAMVTAIETGFAGLDVGGLILGETHALTA